MLYENTLLRLPANAFRRRFGNYPVGMFLLDFLETVVHRIVFKVGYFRFVLRIVTLSVIVERLDEFKILFLRIRCRNGIGLLKAGKQIKLLHRSRLPFLCGKKNNRKRSDNDKE